MTRAVNRRIFLRGLGGACVAAPFLGSLSNRSVRAQGAGAPLRFIAMFTHYGCITSRWFPANSHGDLTAADLAPTTLQALSPYVDKLLMPRGIRAMNQWTSNMSLGQGNDPHTQVCASYFTCQPVTPNGNEPFSFNPDTKFNAMPIGPSLDHVMAQQLSPMGTPLFMHVGNRTDSPQSAISYTAPETPFAGLGTTTQVYSSLTGLFQENQPLSPDSYQALRGKSVIDLVRDDLDSLERADMSEADRNKLEAWKALLGDTGGVLAAAQCNLEVAAALGAPPSYVETVGAELGGDILGTTVYGTLDGADVYSALAALAAVCNANPVIFLKYPANYVFTSLGLEVESHALSHRIADAAMVGGCLAGATEMLLKIDSYYAQKFAHLVGLLNGIEEGDGSVLDNTATVWFQEMSDGNAHNLNNLPIIQAGSAGGYFRTGCAVNVDDGSATLSRGNSEQICNPDVPSLDVVTSSGTDPAFANAPINKYFCNLMNALGVKGGEDGFPLNGSGGPVTRYGRYDRTEDFIGGDVNPPLISDPGEFEALKASS